MNSAQKARWANILTTIVTIIATVQLGMLTNPPFSDQAIFVWGSIFTYITLVGTAWKQYLSPDVSNTGAQVTLWIAVAATITGLADLLDITNWGETTKQWVKWGISITMVVINILSKQIFPSEAQKDKMHELSRLN